MCVLSTLDVRRLYLPRLVGCKILYRVQYRILHEEFKIFRETDEINEDGMRTFITPSGIAHIKHSFNLPLKGIHVNSVVDVVRYQSQENA